MNAYPGFRKSTKRGSKAWFKVGNKSTTYYEQTCAGCGRLWPMRPGRRYCSKSCSATANYPQEQASHPHWKGEGAGKGAKHARISWKATSCIFGCEHTRYERAHNQDDVGPPDEYFPACRSCHASYDNAIKAVQHDRPWHPRKRKS